MARHATGLRQPVERALFVRFITGTVNFSAVAGGNNGSFVRMGERFAQGLELGCKLIGGEGKPTAQVQRCGGVVDS